jgi:hypothetical protein
LAGRWGKIKLLVAVTIRGWYLERLSAV